MFSEYSIIFSVESDSTFQGKFVIIGRQIIKCRYKDHPCIYTNYSIGFEEGRFRQSSSVRNDKQFVRIHEPEEVHRERKHVRDAGDLDNPRA